ncbi:MAG: Lrp/AsnC ligand binding domain-containing protein [Thaumarchaeota archaeon]|nr:Lrp/AsnC ligand binding domain-containing protein [Nitrososphaerota archaeon]
MGTAEKDLVGFIFVETEPGTAFAFVSQLLRKHERKEGKEYIGAKIKEAYVISGRWSVLLKVEAKNAKDLLRVADEIGKPHSPQVVQGTHTVVASDHIWT